MGPGSFFLKEVSKEDLTAVIINRTDECPFLLGVG